MRPPPPDAKPTKWFFGPSRMGIPSAKKTLEDKEFKDWEKKAKFSLDPIYGEEAAKLVNGYIQYYNSTGPTLRKYLL